MSESLPVSPSMSIADCLEFARALLGMEGDDLILVKDGKRLEGTSLALAGVQNGDLLVVAANRPAAAPTASSAPRPAPAPVAASGGGGLDFSNLLGMASAPAAAAASGNGEQSTVYFPGMTIADAVDANPHPRAIVKLIQEHSHLFKELNYHNPILARKLQGQPYERAVQLWREDRVKASIQTSNAITQSYHKEQQMKFKMQANPNDIEAKDYFDSKRKKNLVHQQYQQAMQEYPESMGRVLMLYVNAKINNHNLQAFVDSGAQMTIMSKKCAIQCGIFDLVDTRFAGVAMGVGTGKILGRIHIVQLQIGGTYFPCSVTIMDDAALPSAGGRIKEDGPKPKEMEFLLGLDMLKRHQCQIDLGSGQLKFRLSPGQYLETPFLHEKDLDESKGGTKGFDADKANKELEEAQIKYEEKQSKEGKDAMEE